MKVRPLAFLDFMDGADVRVIQRGGSFRLPVEAGFDLFVV